MLLDFINGKSKVLTGEMFLDLFTAEFRDTLDAESISTEIKPYLVDFKKNRPSRYGICHENSMHNDWIFFVDEEAKIIIANPHYLLNVYNSIRLTDGTGKCVNVLGEYTVIDYSTVIGEVNTLYSMIDEKVITEKKEVILNQMEELVSKKRRTNQVQNIKTRINYEYESCFIFNTTPKSPEILKKLDVYKATYDAAETILSFILDRKSFVELSTIICNRCIEEKVSDVFEYFSILKKLSSDKHDAKLITCRNVLEATKGISEELNIVTVNGEKKRIKTEYHYKYFDTSDGKDFIRLTDIQTIFYKRKTIYTKES